MNEADSCRLLVLVICTLPGPKLSGSTANLDIASNRG